MTTKDRIKRAEAILADFLAGRSPRWIASKYQLTRQSIYMILRTEGVEFSPATRRYYPND